MFQCARYVLVRVVEQLHEILTSWPVSLLRTGEVWSADVTDGFQMTTSLKTVPAATTSSLQTLPAVLAQ